MSGRNAKLLNRYARLPVDYPLTKRRRKRLFARMGAEGKRKARALMVRALKGADRTIGGARLTPDEHRELQALRKAAAL